MNTEKIEKVTKPLGLVVGSLGAVIAFTFNICKLVFWCKADEKKKIEMMK